MLTAPALRRARQKRSHLHKRKAAQFRLTVWKKKLFFPAEPKFQCFSIEWLRPPFTIEAHR
jgi:hypothetical protein